MFFAAKIRAVRRALSAGMILAAILAASAAAQKPTRALTSNEIIELLESGVTPTRVEELAHQYGIKFELTTETEAQLRDAGATEKLLNALRGMTPKVPVPETAPSISPKPTGAAVLVIEATPGGAQVYVDDEPVGRTSSRGRLKLSALAAGDREVRISLDGYLDHEESLELAPQQTLRLVVKLQTAPPPRPAPEPAPPETQPAPEPGSGDRPRPESGPAESASPPQSQETTFPVAHDHAKVEVPYCLGWLTVGDQDIRYRAADNVHVFNFPLRLIKEVKKNGVYMADKGAFRIRLKDSTNYNFSLVKASGPPDLLVGVHRSKAWLPPEPLLAAIASVTAKQ